MSTYKLIAKLGNLKTVVQLLKAVNFKEVATCFGSSNGLKFTVEESKCLQANVYIPVALFEEFELEEDVIFRINLNVMVECLCMFWPTISSQGSNVALQLQYKDVGHPVTLLIEESGIIVDCALKTQEPDEILDFDFDPDAVVNKVLLLSDLLKDVIAEIDHTSNFVELVLSPKAPYFLMSTEGLAGECQVEFSNKNEMVESFNCKKTTKNKYLLSHMKPAIKAMNCSNKVSLRISDTGLLCFQYMIKAEEGTTCFIEFYIVPLIDNEEES